MDATTKFYARAVLAGVFAAAGFGAQANGPIVIGCPTGSLAAQVNVSVQLDSQTTSCPLLDNRDLRKLVDKFAPGTLFAHPLLPNTCMSGSELTGTITPQGGTAIEVTGFTESAQTIFPEARAVGDGLFISGTAPDGGPFMSGAAITIASLRSTSAPQRLDLVLADRFTIDLTSWPFADTEDFVVVGSNGGATASGRLTGTAAIAQLPLEGTQMRITGTLCLK